MGYVAGVASQQLQPAPDSPVGEPSIFLQALSAGVVPALSQALQLRCASLAASGGSKQFAHQRFVHPKLSGGFVQNCAFCVHKHRHQARSCTYEPDSCQPAEGHVGKVSVCMLSPAPCGPLCLSSLDTDSAILSQHTPDDLWPDPGKDHKLP